MCRVLEGRTTVSASEARTSVAELCSKGVSRQQSQTSTPPNGWPVWGQFEPAAAKPRVPYVFPPPAAAAPAAPAQGLQAQAQAQACTPTSAKAISHGGIR